MALTVTKKLPNGQPDVIGGFSQLAVADVLFDNSYATGGEALTAGDLGFPTGYTVVSLVAEPRSGYTFEYDRTNAKLKALVPGVAIGAAGAATIDDFPLSGTGSTATSIGLASTATSPVRFGPQQEVASAVDLSAITTRVVAIAVVV
jgi:hypothetical protein